MNRSLTSLFAAFEALLVALIGIGIPLAPLTVLWAFQYGFAIDWSVFWRASVDIWLLGHGADLTVTLDKATATASDFVGADRPFTLSIALLGFAFLTVLLGMRAGRRIAETDHRLLGQAVAIGTFALLSLGATATAQHPLATPSAWQGFVLPTLVFSLGIFLGTVRTRPSETDDTGSAIREWIDDWRPTTSASVFTALRGGASAVAAIVAVSAVIVAGLIFASYAQIITLYEGLHAEALGGAALTIAQLAILPNLVLWCSSWLVGPGFALGAGSSVSPIATIIGPIPPVPVLGALPTGDSPYGFIGLLVPIVAAFLVGAYSFRGLAAAFPSGLSVLRIILTGIGMGIVGGVLLALLAWASSGSAGPGRLDDYGPHAITVGVWATVEIAVASVIGLFAGRRLPHLVPRRR